MVRSVDEIAPPPPDRAEPSDGKFRVAIFGQQLEGMKRELTEVGIRISALEETKQRFADQIGRGLTPDPVQVQAYFEALRETSGQLERQVLTFRSYEEAPLLGVPDLRTKLTAGKGDYARDLAFYSRKLAVIEGGSAILDQKLRQAGFTPPLRSFDLAGLRDRDLRDYLTRRGYRLD